MLPEETDVAQSARRIRRGCLASAAVFAGLALLFVSATGNLFYLVFLIGAALALLIWWITKQP